MKAWRYRDPANGPELVRDEFDCPAPGAGELLVRVHAVGVTPTERLWYPSTHQTSGEPRKNAIPGHEFAGVILAVGSGSGEEFAVGQAVYGMNDWFAEGATAEYCRTTPSAVAPKPRRSTDAEAASAPISALTAWQGLFDRALLKAGEHVLVHGGSGAVGVYVVQLAHRHGARVTVTASAGNLQFVRDLGADTVLDYRADRFEEQAKAVDVVFDTVGGETLDRSWGVLGPAGRMVTVAAAAEGTADERTRRAFFIVEPNGAQLREIGKLFDDGHLRPVVGGVFPFDQAPRAYLHKPARGKVVLTVFGAPA